MPSLRYILALYTYVGLVFRESQPNAYPLWFTPTVWSDLPYLDPSGQMNTQITLDERKERYKYGFRGKALSIG